MAMAAGAGLHISLARPIYLPAPSVASFLENIDRGIRSVLSVARGTKVVGGSSGTASDRRRGNAGGRTLHLRPRDSIILVNDTRTRSFLSIPICSEGSRWAKRALLPPIDAVMTRFGLETYYHAPDDDDDDNHGGGCILHVSVASVGGDVIPRMLERRRRRRRRRLGVGGRVVAEENGGPTRGDDDCDARRTPLFSKEEREIRGAAFESLPSCIPVRVDRVVCDFGMDKSCTIPI
jgi:hypothetical protein